VKSPHKTVPISAIFVLRYEPGILFCLISTLCLLGEKVYNNQREVNFIDWRSIMEDLKLKTRKLADDLVYELNKSLGFQKGGISHTLLRPLVWKPMFRFSELATVFEHRLKLDGWQKASGWFASHFIERMKSIGEDHLPEQGPLIVASNHPGAYDALAISSMIPRDDVKIIASEIPFVRKLPNTSQHMIFSDHDPHNRMTATRKALRHLKNGGALLLFARASMDPDPAIMPNSEAEINRWSSSLGLFLRQIPQTRIAISMISGVLSPKFLNHPATRFRRGRVNKQRLSEFFQVMHQLMSPGKLMVTPSLSFGKAYTMEDLGLKGSRDIDTITKGIIEQAQEQFKIHSASFLTP
jgi:hypothetical protein